MITKLQVKYIQSLRQKKFRDEEGVFVAEGPKIINELLAGYPETAKMVYATAEWIEAHANLLKNIAAEKIVAVKETEMERLSFLETAHSVLAVFTKPAPATAHVSRAFALMLDGIQDPGNLGTIIRTADWFGIGNIFCSADCADAFAPKVVQATMGSIVRVKLLYTDLVKLAKEKKSWQLFAATLNGENLHTLETAKEGIIVIGSEGKGISPALLDCCQHRITIPRLGDAESLNAAVAAGIILSRLTS